MLDIHQIDSQEQSNEIVMVAKDHGGKMIYAMTECCSHNLPNKNENRDRNARNEFNECKEMIKLAKSISGITHMTEMEKAIEKDCRAAYLHRKSDRLKNTNSSVKLPAIKKEKQSPIKPKMNTSHWYSNPIPIVRSATRFKEEQVSFACSEDFKKWLLDISILFLFKKNFIQFLKALFQGGEHDTSNNLFKYQNLIVILETQFISSLNMTLPCFGWYDIYNLFYGDNISSLCLYYLRTDFDTVAKMFNVLAEEQRASLKIKNKEDSPWNIQVKNPVNKYYIPTTCLEGADLLHLSEYLTPYGHVFKRVEYWRLKNEEIIDIYKTIWRPWNGQKYHCQIIPPEPPYSLYNLHLIHKYLEAIIVFVSKEHEADHWQKHNKPNNYVFTTCYGGENNILDADLSKLSQRRLIICFTPDSPEVHLIPKVIKRLESQNVKEIRICFEKWKNYISSQEFMTDPGKWGCNIEPEEESKNQYRIVPSGKKVNGEDKESVKLLEPISEKGDHIYAFGLTGSYKSYFGNSLAVALSIGNKKILKWSSGEPLRVLYIDGEMRPNSFKKRLKRIMKGLEHFDEERPFDLYMVKDASGANIDTDILSDEWQEEMKERLKKYDVIIIDNFYSLTDNSIASVKKALDWFKRLTQDEKTVIVLDHSNRDGDLQGSILKERAADLVIKIDPDKVKKGRVKMSFPKTRELPPEYTKPFDIEMIFQDDTFRMEVVDSEEENDQPLSERDFKIALALELTNARGVDREQILEMLQIKQATYYKYLKEELPRLSEKQKFQVKSEADRLLEALTS